MSPPSNTETVPNDELILDAIPVGFSDYVRGVLVATALGLIGIFAVAAWINPYEADGRRRTMETHTQLGLPPCTFYKVTGVPCPSCGMTTSFALLVRGDVAGSLYVNAAGTMLAALGLFLIPWCLACAWYGRTLFVRSFEWTLMILVVGFTTLSVARWVIVVAWTLRPGGTAGG